MPVPIPAQRCIRPRAKCHFATHSQGNCTDVKRGRAPPRTAYQFAPFPFLIANHRKPPFKTPAPAWGQMVILSPCLHNAFLKRSIGAGYPRARFNLHSYATAVRDLCKMARQTPGFALPGLTIYALLDKNKDPAIGRGKREWAGTRPARGGYSMILNPPTGSYSTRWCQLLA